MKTIYKLGILALFTVIFCLFIACEQPAGTPKVTLTGITANYTGGSAAINTDVNSLKSNLTVTATYSDNSAKTLKAADYSLSGDLSASGQKTVTVTYKGKTTTFTVTVTATPSGKTLTGITAVYTPTTAIFPDTTHDTLKEGLTVTAIYSDNTTAPVTAYTLSGDLTEGESVITVTYTEGGVTKTGTFTVTVGAPHQHNWSKISETAATCTTAGVEVWECTAITPSHTEDRPIPIVSTAHNYIWQQTTAPTCTAAGVESQVCTYNNSHIGETRTGAVALGHDWNTAYTTTTAATETTDGIEAITCKNDPSHTQNPRTLYATGTEGLEFVLLDSGDNSGTYRVSKGTTGNKSAIHIPAYWRGNSANYEDYLLVTEISNGSDAWNDTAFGGTNDVPNTTLTSITFAAESQLTTISAYAFWNCTSLTSITIPEGVTFIGGQAFQNCTGLASITIPASVTSISGNAFQNCTSLTSITIPASVTYINNQAFLSCTGLTSITVDANNPNYTSQDGILYNKAKTAIITIPAGISGSITIPEGVTSIGNNAFFECASLTGITIPNSVTSIGEMAFYNCTSLTSINIPAGVTSSIGYGMFWNCRSLTSVTIPEGVTSIGSVAFRGCNNLASIAIPASVTSIGDMAFQDCTGLTGNLTIPDGVTSISRYAFSNCQKLTSITIPEGVTSIGDYAFSWCARLISINIPAGVTSIGNSAFYACLDLTGNLTIPNGVTSIGNYAFADCNNLASITIPASVTSIGKNAFRSWFNYQLYIEGHASQEAADTAWNTDEDENWRSNSWAVIQYWNGSSYQ